MSENKKQNFFVGNDAHWENIYECNDEGKFYKDSETDFVVCNYTPSKSVEAECEFISTFPEKFKALDLQYVLNTEFANWHSTQVTEDGFDWCNTDDGCHRLNLHPKFIQTLTIDKNCLGIMYDEMEHSIINRNLTLTINKKGKHLPVFPLALAKDVVIQGELLRLQLKEFADYHKNNGAQRFIGEHVFPVLFHSFAASGIIPNFKSQKESYSVLQYVNAAGAALQYKTELWNCVDLWNYNTFPGHSPKEMYYNLWFSYLAGTSRVYVEGASQFFTDGKPNEYANEYKKFSTDERRKYRDYSVQDYKPEIGIIRYDDTYWGQCDPFMWRPILFGNKNLKVTKTAKEFTRIFHIVTHGETCRNGLAWDRISPWSLRPHKSFCSMNGVAVFDDRVTKETLETLKLCFLCGYYISDNTIGDIINLVKYNGLTVVAPKRFCPEYIKRQTKGLFSEINDGKGKWIVTNNVLSSKTKKSVRGFLGNKGEMKFTYGDKTITMKISKDGNSFELI